MENLKIKLKNYMPIILIIICFLLFWWSFPAGGLIFITLSLLGVIFTDCKLKWLTFSLAIIAFVLCILNWDLQIGMWLRYDFF